MLKSVLFYICKCSWFSLTDEGLTRDSFLLLNEEDLKELGFKMGARNILLRWIERNKVVENSAFPTLLTPSTSATAMSTATPSTSGHASSAVSTPLRAEVSSAGAIASLQRTWVLYTIHLVYINLNLINSRVGMIIIKNRYPKLEVHPSKY